MAEADVFLKFRIDKKELDKLTSGFKKKTIDGKGLQLETPKEFKDASKGFLSASKGLLKAFGIGGSLATIAMMMRSSYSYAAGTVGLARVWGANPRDVSRFTGLMAGFGGTSESSREIFGNVMRGIGDMRMTSSGAVFDMNRMFGLGLGRNAGFDDVIQAMREKAKSLDDIQLEKMASMVGMNTAEGIRLLRASSEEYKARKEFAERQAKLDKAVQKDVEDFQSAWQELIFSFKESASKFSPILNELAETFKLISKYSFVIMEALVAPFKAIYEAAKFTGEGITNLFLPSKNPRFLDKSPFAMNRNIYDSENMTKIDKGVHQEINVTYHVAGSMDDSVGRSTANNTGTLIKLIPLNQQSAIAR